MIGEVVDSSTIQRLHERIDIGTMTLSMKTVRNKGRRWKEQATSRQRFIKSSCHRMSILSALSRRASEASCDVAPATQANTSLTQDASVCVTSFIHFTVIAQAVCCCLNRLRAQRAAVIVMLVTRPVQARMKCSAVLWSI